MAKYIDAEKLMTFLKKKQESCKSKMVDPSKYPIDHIDLMAFLAREYQALILQLDSLQQEQPSLPDNLDEAEFEYAQSLDENPANQEEDKMIYDAFKAGAEWMAGQMKQEQPEVDLDKFAEKIDKYKARHSYPESISVNGAMAFMARMFYQYPNVAKDWYENLPKVTMDDNAAKEESK